MIIFCTASADTYITDKIIDGQFRAEDANVGAAATLDLYKLYNETALNTSGNQNEVSRLLVKFDYDKIKQLTGSKLDLNSSNFRATLKLFDVKAGNATPVNFNVVVFPLSQSFDEGIGKDISAFNDLDDANFITASYSDGTVKAWHTSGANSIGDLGAESIDVFQRANFSDGDGLSLIVGTQNFVKGTENLSIDVTKLVSASVTDQISNHGFRISLSGSDESDKKTRFLKRFTSRHVANPFLRPRVEVTIDDSIQDNHQNFLFDVSGTLFLNSYNRSAAANIVSGSTLSAITGNDCLNLRLRSGSFNFIVAASQHSQGTILKSGTPQYATGVYSASFAIPSNNSSLVSKNWSLQKYVAQSGSITFDAYWDSIDGSVGYHTSSLTINRVPMFEGNFIPQEPLIYILNAKHEYSLNDEIRFRIFGRDLSNEQETPVRAPRSAKPVIFDEVYYRIKDYNSGRIIMSFDEERNATRVSTDTSGMFFDFHMDVLPRGMTYNFEFLIVNRGQRYVVSDKKAIFSVR